MYWLYFKYTGRNFGRSLGQRAMRIAIVHDDGTPVSYVMQINLKEIKLLYADDIIGSQGAGF